MKFFEVKVKTDRMNEKGDLKAVSETYALDAVSFTEAEARVSEMLSNYGTPDFEVIMEKVSQFKTFVPGEGERYFLVKYNFITIDEASGREKRTADFVLFQSTDIDHARVAAHEYMRESICDYEIVCIRKTPILDVMML